MSLVTNIEVAINHTDTRIQVDWLALASTLHAMRALDSTVQAMTIIL